MFWNLQWFSGLLMFSMRNWITGEWVGGSHGCLDSRQRVQGLGCRAHDNTSARISPVGLKLEGSHYHHSSCSLYAHESCNDIALETSCLK